MPAATNQSRSTLKLAALPLLCLAALSGCTAKTTPAEADAGAPLPPGPPTLTGIAPTSGPSTGGTRVTLTGTLFRPGAAVTFGSTGSPSVTVNSSTRITATSPAIAPGTVAVTITNTDTLSATLPAAFLYVPPMPSSACANEPLRSTGTTYYVCDCQAGAESGCAAGSDAAAGTSPSTAWQTFTKGMGQFKTMAAGSTVAFCKGGSWTGVSGGGYIRNQNCTAASTCDMRDYAATWGGAAKPKLQLSAGATFAAMGWYQVYTNYMRGLRFFNLELVGSSADGLTNAETGFNFWGATTDVDVCNVEMHHGFLVAFNLVTNSSLARLTLRDSYIHDNRGANNICVVCGSADDLMIRGNRFDLNGNGNNRSHTVYFWGDAGESQCDNGAVKAGPYCIISRLSLVNNEITRSSWGSGSSCLGVPVVGHDSFDSITIDGNLISEPAGTANGGCYGIQFSNGGNEVAHSTNMVVRNNRIFNVGGNGIAISGAPNVLIENNLIVGGSALGNGIAYPEQPAVGNDLPCNDGTIRNNTIYLAAGGGGSSALTGINEGTGHLFANNAVVTGPTTSSCIHLQAGATAVTNSCSTTGSGWWVAAGLDPNTANFHPAASSNLLGAGTFADAPTTDILGVTRANPPTNGAYEQ